MLIFGSYFGSQAYGLSGVVLAWVIAVLLAFCAVILLDRGLGDDPYSVSGPVHSDSRREEISRGR